MFFQHPSNTITSHVSLRTFPSFLLHSIQKNLVNLSVIIITNLGLSTKEIPNLGSYGSLQFIRKFLSPNFLKKGVTIQGAIILDTIMNVDFLDDSQEVPEDWYNLAPEAADSIKKDNFRCDKIISLSLKNYLNNNVIPFKTKSRCQLSTLVAQNYPCHFQRKLCCFDWTSPSSRDLP